MRKLIVFVLAGLIVMALCTADARAGKKGKVKDKETGEKVKVKKSGNKLKVKETGEKIKVKETKSGYKVKETGAKLKPVGSRESKTRGGLDTASPGVSLPAAAPAGAKRLLP